MRKYGIWGWVRNSFGDIRETFTFDRKLSFSSEIFYPHSKFFWDFHFKIPGPNQDPFSKMLEICVVYF